VAARDLIQRRGWEDACCGERDFRGAVARRVGVQAGEPRAGFFQRASDDPKNLLLRGKRRARVAAVSEEPSCHGWPGGELRSARGLRVASVLRTAVGAGGRRGPCAEVLCASGFLPIPPEREGLSLSGARVELPLIGHRSVARYGLLFCWASLVSHKLNSP